MEIKKAAVIGVSIVLLGAAVLCRHRIRSTWETWDQEVERSLPFPARVQRQRDRLADLAREIAAEGGAVAEAEDMVRQREDELEEWRGQASKERDILRQARTLLDEGRETYEIAGQTFTREAVTADAVWRAGQVRRLDARIDGLQQHIQRLHTSLTEARAALGTDRERRRSLEDELNDLTDRKQSADVLARARASEDAMRGLTDGAGARLQEEMGRLRQDVNATEAAAGGAAAIHYDSPDDRQAIDDALRPAAGR